jgi:patatin-like phospholipase/acyl hydrolase
MSFDGGGIRGVFTAQLLIMLEKESDFLKKIDLFVGTSTGALIALGLAAGLTSEQLVGLYKQFSTVIFKPNASFDEVFSAVPKYDNTLLKAMMTEHVFNQHLTLADLKQKIVVPAFKLHDKALNRWTHHTFHNFNLHEAKTHKVIDVALSSGAAPLYFPSYQGYVDGGVFATNPSMVGLCTALEQNPTLDIKDVQLLSIGSGISPYCIKDHAPWGVKDWLGRDYPLFSMMTEGGIGAVHEQCKQILKNSCHRIDAVLDQVVAIDDCLQIDYLIEKARSLPKEDSDLWKRTLTWIDMYF